MKSAPNTPRVHRVALLDYPASAWREAVENEVDVPYRGDQVAHWVFRHGVFDFDEMSNIPKPLRERLGARFAVTPPRVVTSFESTDGTRRFLLELADGARVESVSMPYRDRLTLCISSQVGCRFACEFCQTGVMGLRRGLSAGEIVGQVLRLRAGQETLDRPVNIVFMGQGEPLDNVAPVRDAIQALQDPAGSALSWRRITLSTVGVVGALGEIAAMGAARPRLAVSLNATTDAVRSKLMPVNRRWPIDALLGELRKIRWRNREHVTFEYVLLAGVNDSLQDAERLGPLLAGLPAKINLIPWNEVSALPFHRPGPDRIERFRCKALESGLDVLVRYSRGADIAAACGQLHSADAARGTRAGAG